MAKNVTSDPKIIVLLGETGVGKTTFAKSICMLEKFVDFTSAAIDQRNHKANGTTETTTTSQDQSENNSNVGESDTRICKVYNVNFYNQLFSIVDTPGIGDTNGLEQDKINLQNIFTTLSSFPAIDSICILLKESDRGHKSFEYFIRQIVSILPRCSLNNLSVVITHGYGFNFEVENVLTILKGSLASGFSQVSNHINNKNTFCIDSQFIKYFSAAMSDKPMVQAELKEKAARECWDVSREEVLRLLEHTTSQLPTFCDALVELSTVKAYISGLNKPIVDVTTTIVENILSTSKLTETIQDILEERIDLESVVSQPHVITRTIVADKPWFTCQTTGCKEKRSSNGNQIDCKKLFPLDLGQAEYYIFLILKPFSHIVPLTVLETLPPSIASAITRFGHIKCSTCDCSLRCHEASFTKNIKEPVHLKNKVMESMVNSNKSQVEALETEQQKRQDEIVQLERELEVLIQIRIKMIYYLKQISSQELHELHQNDLYLERLNGLLQQVNAKEDMNNDKHKIRQLLDRIKNQYLNCMHELGRKSIGFTLQDVRLLKEELSALPINGEIICSILNTLPDV